MSDIPRGTIFGRRVGNPPKSDAEHFVRCPACGGWIDLAIRRAARALARSVMTAADAVTWRRPAHTGRKAFSPENA